MVTVRGEGAQENGRPSEAALRAKMASMTYSFAQELPIVQRRVPPKPPPGPGAPANPPSVQATTRSEDANFPMLTPPPLTRTSGSSSRDPSPASRWGPGNRKPATAAEVVAARRMEFEANSAEDEAATKERAELELYSKLVPTASAVPRNPGRTLGHGGLRSTGSIAAQHRAVSRSKSPPMMLGQPPQSMPRKDPSTSRMRSLFSDATKPQLARKVAASSSRPRSVPPSVAHVENVSQSGQSSSEESGNGVRPSSDKVDVVTSHRRAERAKIMPSNDVRNDVDFANSEARSSAVHPALSRLRDQSASPEPFSQRSDSDSGRRLHEAFSDSGRKIGGRNSSFHSLRKSNGSSGRRSSASPLASLSAQVANGSSGAPEGNVVSSGQTDYVPANGFSNRSKGFSRSKMTNEKAESMAITFSKDGYQVNFSDRDLPRSTIAPTNSRAEALRSAIQGVSRKSNGSSRLDLRKGASNQSGGKDGRTQATSSTPTSSGCSKTMVRRNVPSLPSSESVNTPVSTSSDVSQAPGLRTREQAQTRPVPLIPSTSPWPNDAAPPVPTVAKNNFSLQQLEDTSRFFRSQKASSSADFAMSPRDQIDEDFPSGRSAFLERPARSVEVPASNVRGSSPFDGLSVSEKGSAPGPASLITSGFHLMPGTAIQRVPDARQQKFVKSPILGNIHVAGSRPWPMNEDRVNNVKVEELAQELTEFNLSESRPLQVQSRGVSRDYRTTVGSGQRMDKSESVVSMIDVLKNWQTQQGISANPKDVIEDAVLPPLPDSNDHGRFELILRQMGYNSDDEGEGPVRPESSTNMSVPTSHTAGQSTKYYSHFS